MVNMNENENEEIEEVTDENIEIEEPEIEDLEEMGANKIKKMREKLARCEEEKKQILDESQRTKADFLNARKRLEDERARDRVRFRTEHVLDLLPLCDSFQMAMSNKETWEKVDQSWRTGIEGILTQLNRILESNGVSAIDPVGEAFDPYRHEAIGTEEVEDESKVDVIITVVQRGYEMKVGDKMEVIRHARVTTGTLKK